MQSDSFEHVALVGVGLLGGSLGKALCKRRVAGKVTGWFRDPAKARLALQCQGVDVATDSLGEAIATADLVVLGTPLLKMRPLTQELLPYLRPGTCVTDLGSVKTTIVTELEPLVASAKCHFVGGHPMAGSEKSGIEHATADLFENKVCILTPTGTTHQESLKRVAAMWQGLNCQVLEMAPETHDRLVARSSHLPHLLASSLTRFVLNPELGPEQAALCASGFHDSTRVASGSPEMWHDIAVSNRAYLAETLSEYRHELSRLQELLIQGDGAGIKSWFENSKSLRDEWLKTYSNSSSNNPEPN